MTTIAAADVQLLELVCGAQLWDPLCRRAVRQLVWIIRPSDARATGRARTANESIVLAREETEVLRAAVGELLRRPAGLEGSEVDALRTLARKYALVEPEQSG